LAKTSPRRRPINHEERNRAHMERCLAVQRRGQLERVLRKINAYEAWERAIETGVVVGIHKPDDPPLSEREREELAILYKMRDEIVAEMKAVGQT